MASRQRRQSEHSPSSSGSPEAQGSAKRLKDKGVEAGAEQESAELAHGWRLRCLRALNAGQGPWTLFWMHRWGLGQFVLGVDVTPPGFTLGCALVRRPHVPAWALAHTRISLELLTPDLSLQHGEARV